MTFKPLQTCGKHARRLLTLALAAHLLPLAGLPAFVPAAAASVEIASTEVGSVSLVLGKAWLLRPGAERERISVGTTIHVSDTIETNSNGHVHIHFVDEALVSVRPASTLEIVRYDYRPEAPAESVVKFNLVEGVARAISGKAAEAARQNFRLNTPIAAIGVRGTDFRVSASDSTVRARVTHGAIVVAPFSNLCSADALGPCSQNALELAGGVSQLVQISSNMLQPELVPVAPSELEQTMLAQTLGPVGGRSAQQDNDDDSNVYTDSVSSLAFNQSIAGTRAIPPEVAEFTPDVAVSSQALNSNALVWGRYSEAGNGDERITLLANAANFGNLAQRRGTVGNSSYGLFRSEADSKLVQPGLGLVGFNLKQAQAVYKTIGNNQLMDVLGGRLNIDFNNSQFSTSLNLQHAATGNVRFSDSGVLHPYGYFNSRGATQNMAGSVSLDGAEAGYFFEKTLQSGSIEGLTLWGRQP